MRWCLRESREMPSRVSSSDPVLCLAREVGRAVRLGNRWEARLGRTYFSRRDFMMSLADDMLPLIWSSRSQNAWTSSSLGVIVTSCTSDVAISADEGLAR